MSNIRNLTLGKPTTLRKIEFEYEGEKVYFHQPTRKIMKQLQQKSMVGGEFDFATYQALSVIYLTFDKDGNSIFNEADLESFMELPATGGWFETFAEKVASAFMDEVADPKPSKED